LARPETIMTYNTLPEGSVVLRLEFSIADAVHQRGLAAVLGAAIAAWWNRPRVPSDLPDDLRSDVGLPSRANAAHWTDIPMRSGIPDPLRRPSM
jgi:hypothetical protein